MKPWAEKLSYVSLISSALLMWLGIYLKNKVGGGFFIVGCVDIVSCYMIVGLWGLAVQNEP